jgi:hypothetical protein
VDTLRPRLDSLAFAVALALLAWPAVRFIAERNGGAAIMCAMCLAGLVAGRVGGVPGRVLLPVALGLAAVLFLIWVESPIDGDKTSELAHVIGGTLAGWALAETLSRRIHDPVRVALISLGAVVALTFVWELGEFAGDELLGTSLRPSMGDSLQDILLGSLGGLVGVGLASLIASWRRPQM